MNVLPPAGGIEPGRGESHPLQEHPSHEPDTALARLLGDFTALASQLCDTPMALVSQLHGQFSLAASDGDDSLVPARRQWWRFPEQAGVILGNIDFNLCDTAAGSIDDVAEIGDLNSHARFAATPMTTGASAVRFYAAAAFSDTRGAFLGTLGVLDSRARALTPGQRAGLPLLARNLGERLGMQREINRLQHQAMTDALTGIGNRRAFDQRLHEEWARHLRSGAPMSVLMIDVNRFKQYNDTYGHPAGDKVLEKLGQLLRMPLRGSDFVARYGGDEFAVILPETADEGALFVVRRIHAAMDNTAWPHRPITLSIGIASLSPEEHCDFDMLLHRADQAMYCCKRRA